MSYQIALQFEDGLTRMIDCAPGEKLSDAAYRQKVNIPLDCRDGACGTCRATCESGHYDMPGSSYIEDALTPEEAAAGGVLACQMKPRSDCVVQIAAASTACKVAPAAASATVTRVEMLSDSTIALGLRPREGDVFRFLPGQYARLTIPGSPEQRAYSFSSAPGHGEWQFVIRNVPGGQMSRYLCEQARVGDDIAMSAPFGSFYLRPLQRPTLFLAGGTGIAPFLSMLESLAGQSMKYPIRLVYGVTTPRDLVATDVLDRLSESLPSFEYRACVAQAGQAEVRSGYVTQHIDPAWLHDGDCDVYVCGPTPMVDAVRRWQSEQGFTPRNFFHEKFSASGGAS